MTMVNSYAPVLISGTCEHCSSHPALCMTTKGALIVTSYSQFDHVKQLIS